MPRICTVATCNLNQWAMDFEGNLARIEASIREAKGRGARYRVGPELEVCGYGCEDHFLEDDTFAHSWECVTQILSGDLTDGMVCDMGMPVLHAGVRYNCRVICLNRRVVAIRPKMCLANDGNYRETRYFAAWKEERGVEAHTLPRTLVNLAGGEATAPFGHVVLHFADTRLGFETCEELFTPLAPHIQLALNGVEIVANGSGSHHQLRKLNQRMELIQSATRKAGGLYLYSNQRGCDGSRLYFDGCSCVMLNGELVKIAPQFALGEVEVAVASVDLDDVTSYRGGVASMQQQMSEAARLPIVHVAFELTHHPALTSRPDPAIDIKYHLPEEEIAFGPAAWLWDYLRRSGASGFLLPLSGGADSAATAAIVGAMCQMVVRAVHAGDQQVIADVRRIAGYQAPDLPDSAKKLAERIFSTIYMGTVNSSKETCARSCQLAAQIGAKHMDVRIDSVVAALVSLFEMVCKRTPRFKIDGGSFAENQALQNIQARMRMVVAFLLAQLLPWTRGGAGFLLVLGSANVDEGLRGYLTKYDCSSADVNPIGGISKSDIRRFLRWGASYLGYPELGQVEAAAPTAELEPLRDNHVQTDEEDMGMTYDELTLFGRLRKVARCGPVTMYKKLVYEWRGVHSPSVVAEKVKRFFHYYAMNRHKMTTITPCYHAENYSPDDNRFDLRQFMYNIRWPWQFRRIDTLAGRDQQTVTET